MLLSTYNKTRANAWLTGCLLLFFGQCAQAQLDNRQRYLALMLLNLGDKAGYGLDYIQESKNIGANAVHLAIKWHVVYPTAASAPRWDIYDQQIQLCKQLGLKVAIRIHVVRNTGMLDTYWQTSESMRDHTGAVMQNIYGNTAFSYADRKAVEKCRSFIQEVCQRYTPYQQQGVIGWVSVASNVTQELGYQHDNWPNFDYNKAYNTLYDYSEPAQAEFRIWLERKYKKIERLNLVYKSNYTTFVEVGPPTPSGDLATAFAGLRGRDWYVFRHLMLRTFIEQTTETIKKTNPNYKIVGDFGSVFDELSLNRSSYGFIDLTKNLDGIKINDDLRYDHRFSMDVIRSNANGRWVMNEVFYDRNAPDYQAWVKEMTRQVNENFENGANWISVVLTDREQFDRGKEVLANGASKWLSKPYENVQAMPNMTYTLSNIIDNNYKNGGIYGAWSNLAGTTEPRRPVSIRLIEDILADSLQGTINRAPIVRNAFPTKTVAVNVPFIYRVPPEIFEDLDGKINRIEARTLPTWLKYENGTLSGTPTRTGTYSLTLRATDDDGASVEATGNIVVDNAGKVNQKPFLKKKISSLSVIHKQSFAVALLDSAYFGDNDGFIVKIEATNLPPWAELKKGVLLGTPPNVGRFTVNLTAYDDDNATTSTTLDIEVTYPQVRFDMYQGGQPGTRKYIQRVANDNLLVANDLPASLNIYATCDVPLDSLVLTLTGPYYQKRGMRKFPYTLFEGSGGFPLVAGTYQLQGVAYSLQKTVIANTTVRFSLNAIDPKTQKAQEIPEWVAYPNPFDEVINVKLPPQIKTNALTISMINLFGQEQIIPATEMSVTDHLLSIYWRKAGLIRGVYWLRIKHNNEEVKLLKVLSQ